MSLVYNHVIPHPVQAEDFSWLLSRIAEGLLCYPNKSSLMLYSKVKEKKMLFSNKKKIMQQFMQHSVSEWWVFLSLNEQLYPRLSWRKSWLSYIAIF